MNAEFLDEALLRTLAATLAAEFEYVRLYHPTARVLMFLASDAPLDVELELARTGRPLVDDVMHFSRFGLNGVEDLLAALAMDEQGILSFARRAEISTDDNNLMATRSRARADGLTPDELLELFAPYDPLVRPGSWIHTQLGEADRLRLHRAAAGAPGADGAGEPTGGGDSGFFQAVRGLRAAASGHRTKRPGQ